MADERLKKFARLLIQYSTRVQPGDRVAVHGYPLTAAAEPLLVELVREILAAGGLPHVLIDSEAVQALYMRDASETQLSYVNPLLRMVAEEFEVDIRLSSAGNTRTLATLDPAQLNRVREASKSIVDTWFQRSATKKLRWMATRFPTNAYAQDAEMSLAEFEDFFYSSCLLDLDDPIQGWKHLAAEQARQADILNQASNLHLRGPDIDLKLSVAGRKFIPCSGETNMPAGEIFTGPVEDSAQGWVHFSYPCIHNQIETDDVELTFEDGRVVKASAAKGDAYLQATLEADAGARYLGELGIGTNKNIQRFTRSMLFDEKIAGTIHLALGGGYPETGSTNRSAIHWDMLVDMRAGEIIADGELIYKNGDFIQE
ncbi:MAG: aminopeptidase [Anaerolineales bacterium]